MNWSNKFLGIAELVIAFLSLIGVVITFYVNRHKSTLLEVKTVSELELTRPLNVEHLSSIYMFYDSIPVEHLWQSSFVITNIGETALYGSGFDNKSIKGDKLLYRLLNCEKVLSIELMGTNADVSIGNNSLNFSQWRPSEYVELRILSDGASAPELQISDRDIIDGKVIYTKYSPNDSSQPRKLVDRFPSTFSKVLWWIVIIFEVILFIALLIAGVSQYTKAPDRATQISTIIVWTVVLALMFAPLLWMF